ncbi:MAG: peptidylprolyl isomerase [Planctomycetota bacterium]|nr:peptidylprolyl isomerase [Planctomycetota bacterium]MDA1211573.1 peptidylprolyl isomerase [Planctomycetota bacterium]
MESPKKPNRWALFFGGTAFVVLIAAVMMQVMRDKPNPALADTTSEENDRSERSARGRVAPDRAVAKVGDVVINYEDLAQECVQVTGRKILDDMINRLIIQQACDKRQIEVTPAEVDAEVLKISKQFNLPVESWYQMLESEQGLTKGQYRRDVIWPILALRKLAGEQTEISEDEIKRSFIRDYGPRVKARIIVLDNQRRAQAVWEEANRGTPDDFERLAAAHSIEPTSRSLRGAIPPIRRYVGNDELEKVAFKLKAGEISGIIQIAASRYAILLCEGQTEPVVSGIDEVREIIIGNLVEEKAGDAVNQVFAKLKEETLVDNYLTNTRTGGAQSSDFDTAGTAKIRPTSAVQKPSSGKASTRTRKPATN